MAASDTKNGMCNCGMTGRHWTFFLLRTLLTILILMVIFWFGVEVGRMSGGYYGRAEFGGVRAMPMMQINGATSSPMMGGVQNY